MRNVNPILGSLSFEHQASPANVELCKHNMPSSKQMIDLNLMINDEHLA
jgi:hypothetical protein